MNDIKAERELRKAEEKRGIEAWRHSLNMQIRQLQRALSKKTIAGITRALKG